MEPQLIWGGGSQTTLHHIHCTYSLLSCRQRGQFEPERLSYSTPTRPATQSPNTEESAGEESESDQSQGQFVSGTGKPTVTRRLIPLNQTHRCTSLTGGVSPGPKEHVELSLDNGGGAVPVCY